MKIDILTLFPHFFSPLRESIVGNAQKKNLLQIQCHQLRDYSFNKQGKIDDSPYGGESGMVLKADVMANALKKIQSDKKHTIFLTPQGKLFTQKRAKELATTKEIVLICGHYKGIDHRIREHYVDEEISIGDYVLTGGELPAMVLIDSIARLIPDVLTHIESATADSFFEDKNLLSNPVYTRPEIFEGHKVPSVLLSGNHQEIEHWKKEQQINLTKQKRPDLLQKRDDKMNS